MPIDNKKLKKKFDSDVERAYCISQRTPNCKKHGGFRTLNHYYNNYSDLFASDKAPICKDCLKDMIYLDEDGNNVDKDRFLRALALIDKPFIEQHWESALRTDNDFLGIYIGLIARYNQDMTFNDGDELFERRIKYEFDETPITFDDLIITKEMVVKWGENLSNKDYAFLEYNYNRLVSDYVYEGYVSEILFTEMCHIMLAIYKERESKKPDNKKIKDLNTSLNSTIKSVKLKVEDNKNNVSESEKPIGIKTRDLEERSPAEEKMDDKFKDIDGIGKIIKEHFLDQLKRSLGD